jgi:hypothetical protein
MHQHSLRTSLATVATTALAACVVLAGCGSGQDTPSAARTADAPSARGASPTSTAPKPASTDSASRSTKPRPADALAPKTRPVVLRNGKVPTPTYSEAPQAFDKPLVYDDGLKLEIVEITQGTVEEQGPGVFTGDPKTTLEIKLSNDSEKAIDLNQVVVSATYGKPARIARPTYGESARDFYGSVEPGDSADAAYVFSVPTKHLSNVTMTMDFDGTHAAATFRGAAK